MGFNYAKYKAAVTGSPLNKNGFGPEEKKTTRTGDSGNLREVISDVRTKAADVIGKIHKGFDVPLMTEAKKINKTTESMTTPPNTVQNVGRLGSAAIRLGYGLMPGIFGKLGGQVLENVIRPGKQSPQFDDQMTKSFDDAKKKIKSAVPKKTDKGKRKKSKMGLRKAREKEKVDFYYGKRDGVVVKINRNTGEIIKD